MAGGVGELLCLGRLVTGLTGGAHSSLLEFDTWRLALSSHPMPQRCQELAENVLKAYLFSTTTAGQDRVRRDLKITPGPWHFCDTQGSTNHPY